MSQINLYEDINQVVNSQFTRIDISYLNEAVINNEVFLIEDLKDNIKQKLLRVAKTTSITAAGLAFLMLSVTPAKANPDTVQKVQTKIFSPSEIKKSKIFFADSELDKALTNVKKAYPKNNSFLKGRKDQLFLDGKTKVPFDWDSRKDNLYFWTVITPFGENAALLDDFGKMPMLLVPSSDNKYLYGLSKSSNNKWGIFKTWRMNEAGPLVKKYLTLLNIVSHQEKLKGEKKLDSNNIQQD